MYTLCGAFALRRTEGSPNERIISLDRTSEESQPQLASGSAKPHGPPQ